jgi:GxxExxY protein
MDRIIENDPLTEKIIGCALKVHKILGCGFKEVIYQRALEKEMWKAGLNFARELEMDIMYEGESIGKRRVDFLVESSVMVELKAITLIDEIVYAQALNYLRVYNVQKGLILNFGNTKLQIKRLVN